MTSNLSNLDDSQFLTATSKSENILPLVEGSEYLPPTVQPDAPSTQITTVSLDEIPTEKISVPEEVEMIPFNFFEIEPNDTRQQADNIGPVFCGDYIPIYGDVGNGDPSDWFQFKLKKPAEVNLDLSGLNADADLNLFDKNGNLIDSSSNGGTLNESIVAALTKGKYYVEVSSWDQGFTDYLLELCADCPDQYEENDNFNQAYDLGNVVGGSFATNGANIGGCDDSDFFKFTLQQPTQGEGELKLSGLSADADLYLYDQNKNLLNSSTLGGNNDESMVGFLDSGTYYVKVHSWDGNFTDYLLEGFAGGCSPDQYEVNDTRQQAYNLGQVYKGDDITIPDANIGGGDSADWFKFILKEEAEVTLDLSGLSADADLNLWDKNGNPLAFSNNPGTLDESIVETLPKSKYFIEVVSYDGICTDYVLDLSTGGDIYEPNNTHQQAHNLGKVFNNDFVLISDGDDANIGDGDTLDYFKFNLKEFTTVDILLSNLSADVNLSLQDKNRSEIASSKNSGNDPEWIITQPTNKGVHYIEVRSVDGNYTDYYLDILTYDDIDNIMVPIDRIS